VAGGNLVPWLLPTQPEVCLEISDRAGRIRQKRRNTVMDEIKIGRELILGAMWGRDSGELTHYGVLIDNKDGHVVVLNDSSEHAVFIPYPQPAYLVTATLPDGHAVNLGCEIPGNPPNGMPDIDWQALASAAWKGRQKENAHAATA
jgi:hypothetical protein